MKGNRLKIGTAILIIVIVAVGAVASAKVISMVQKAFMSPAEYYQSVEMKNLDNIDEMMLDYHNAIQENYSGDSYAKSVTMKMEISDTAKALLSLSGVDFSSLKDLELDLVTGKEKSAYSSEVKLKGNGNGLVTLKTYMDAEKEKVYCQVPELSKSYLDISSLYQQNDTSALPNGGNRLFSLYGLGNMFADADSMRDDAWVSWKAIFGCYKELLLRSAENEKNVEKKNDKGETGISAEGITQKADKYVVSLENSYLIDFLMSIKEDKTIQGITAGMSKNATQSFTDALDQWLESVDGVEEDSLNASMEVHIGSGDRIIGRTLIISGSAVGGKLVINFFHPMDGNEFGFLLNMYIDEVEYVSLHGKGTWKSGLINGDFTMDIDESLNDNSTVFAVTDNLFTISLKDYDVSKLAKGEVRGTVIYSTNAVAALANYAIKIEIDGGMKDSTGRISILAGSETFATIDVTAKDSEKPGATQPSEGDTVYDVNSSSDMLLYQSEMDFVQLLEDFQNKLGIDFSGLIQRLL